MGDVGQRILDHLAGVQAERARRSHVPGLERRVTAIKAYQQARLAHTHADLLADPRCAPAARFFLDELYGPRDFTARDAQFVRVVPALVRLFPGTLSGIVERVAALHALSESLDSAMAEALPWDPDLPLEPAAYAHAWREVGRATARAQQIDSVVEIGVALDAHARRPMLRHTLRWMRGPAQAAGLAELQAFLEVGLEAFASLPDAAAFLDTVSRRERELATALFSGHEAALC